MFLILFLFVVITSWLCLRWLKVKRYWADRRVPHLPPNFLLGSLTFLQRENPAIWMLRMYARFRSPYVGVWLFWRPALVVNSPELARRILVKDFDVFRNRFLGSGRSDPIGALNLFTVNDPIWSMLRRRLTAAFTATKLRSLHGLFVTKCAELCTRIKNYSNGTCGDLRSLYADFTTDVISMAAFGIKSDATLTGDSAVRKVTKDFMQYDTIRGLSWSSIFFFPELVDYFRFSFFPKDTTDYFRDMFKNVLTDRREIENEEDFDKDLLDILLRIKREASKIGTDISEDLVVAQATIFLFGGFDTTAVTLTYVTYELAFNPEVQQKLYGDLVEAKRKTGDLDGSVLSEVHYLTAVIKETMRLHPSMGWLDRIASRDYKIDDNLTISAGTPVYVNAVGMHHDAELYPDPERFDPERFMPENEGNLKTFTFMPFGEGPRSCIGKRFAYQTLRYVLATVFLNFEVRPLPSSPLPEDCEIEKKGLFLAPEKNLSVQFIPRT